MTKKIYNRPHISVIKMDPATLLAGSRPTGRDTFGFNGEAPEDSEPW